MCIQSACFLLVINHFLFNITELYLNYIEVYLLPRVDDSER